MPLLCNCFFLPFMNQFVDGETFLLRSWFHVEKWFPIDELNVAELSNSTQKIQFRQMLYNFFSLSNPVGRLRFERTTRKWSIMFWSICGHFEFLPRRNVFLPLFNISATYIERAKNNPAIWYRWLWNDFSCFEALTAVWNYFSAGMGD